MIYIHFIWRYGHDGYVLVRFPDKETVRLIHSSAQEYKKSNIEGSKLRKNFIWYQPCPCCTHNSTNVFAHINYTLKLMNSDKTIPIKNIVVRGAELIKKHFLKDFEFNLIEMESPYKNDLGNYKSVARYINQIEPLVSFNRKNNFELKLTKDGLVCTL